MKAEQQQIDRRYGIAIAIVLGSILAVFPIAAAWDYFNTPAIVRIQRQLQQE